MTIWEEYGTSIEDYAKTFNKELDEAWKRILKNKIYNEFNVIEELKKLHKYIHGTHRYELERQILLDIADLEEKQAKVQKERKKK